MKCLPLSEVWICTKIVGYVELFFVLYVKISLQILIMAIKAEGLARLKPWRIWAFSAVMRRCFIFYVALLVCDSPASEILLQCYKHRHLPREFWLRHFYIRYLMESSVVKIHKGTCQPRPAARHKAGNNVAPTTIRSFRHSERYWCWCK